MQQGEYLGTVRQHPSTSNFYVVATWPSLAFYDVVLVVAWLRSHPFPSLSSQILLYLEIRDYYTDLYDNLMQIFIQIGIVRQRETNCETRQLGFLNVRMRLFTWMVRSVAFRGIVTGEGGQEEMQLDSNFYSNNGDYHF